MANEKILIVEDETIIALDIKLILDELGYNVTAMIASGEDAIRKTEEILPDLVLMDINLKGRIDGLRAAEVIQNQFKIPVVYVTGYTDDKTLNILRQSKSAGFIPKPFNEIELHSIIILALQSRKLRLQYQQSNKDK